MNFSRTATLLAAAAIAAGGLSCATGTKTQLPPGIREETLPLVGSFRAHRYSYPNGLRLVVVEDPSSPTLAYQTWFRVGSRDEVPNYTGLAHLFEHMMFKGTKNVKDGEFDRLLEGAGAEGQNAFTSQDYTAYIQEMPTSQLELIARLEADRMVNLIVDEKSFKTETNVVQEERRLRKENSPEGTLYQELFETAFTRHPYHWPVIGYQQDLDRMSASDAVKFYRTHYSPNHATVIVVGAVDAERVAETVARYYSAIPRVDSEPRVTEAEPPQTEARRKTLKMNIQVEKLLMGYHVPDVVHPDVAALEVLAGVLAGGKSGRLQRALVETGIAATVYGGSEAGKDPSLFVIGATLQKGKKAAHAEAVILKELQRLAKEPVPDQELARAKNGINFGFYEGLGGNSEKANFIGHYESVAKGFEDGLRIRERIQTVTAADVMAAAQRYFESKNRTVITGVPQ